MTAKGLNETDSSLLQSWLICKKYYHIKAQSKNKSISVANNDLDQ